jgi:hypothetical protein
MWKVPLTSTSRSLLAVLLAALLLLGACTDDPEAGGNEGEPETAAEPEAPPFCPLTGEDPPKDVKLTRPALALKIENSPEAMPQSGLDQADIVYEEIVEGGATRFMAIYHCHDAAKGGPVRSARFDDPKIAKPFTRILAYSGANLIVQNEIRKQKLIPLHEQNSGGALFRVPAGSTDVHSLFGDTRKLRQLGVKKRKLDPPGSAYFKFDDAPKGGKAKSVTLKFNPNVEISWRWKGGKWTRFEDGVRFLTAGGKQVSTSNLFQPPICWCRRSRSTTLKRSSTSPGTRRRTSRSAARGALSCSVTARSSRDRGKPARRGFRGSRPKTGTPSPSTSARRGSSWFPRRRGA